MCLKQIQNLPKEGKDTHIGGGLMEVGAPIVNGSGQRMYWPQLRCGERGGIPADALTSKST